MAGRSAFLGGRWKTPCQRPLVGDRIHLIAAPGHENPIRLCDHHFLEAQAAGFVNDPFVTQDEYVRRGGKL